MRNKRNEERSFEKRGEEAMVKRMNIYI